MGFRPVTDYESRNHCFLPSSLANSSWKETQHEVESADAEAWHLSLPHHWQLQAELDASLPHFSFYGSHSHHFFPEYRHFFPCLIDLLELLKADLPSILHDSGRNNYGWALYVSGREAL
jgi:hypothetical protein